MNEQDALMEKVMRDQNDADDAAKRFAITGIVFLTMVLIWLLATGEMIVHGR